MDSELTGPVWDAIHAAGIAITHEADGWLYIITPIKGLGFSAGGHDTAEEALEAALVLLVGVASGRQQEM